jgi:hypothetical protein
MCPLVAERLLCQAIITGGPSVSSTLADTVRG